MENSSVNNLKSRPLYQEVHNTLAHEIATGVYAPGALLPGTEKLALRFGVSADTVARALAQLAAESMIRCRRGSLPRVLPFRQRKSNLKIAILVDTCYPDEPYNYSYASGSWCWSLHQQLMLQLLETHYPVINLSWQGDWCKQLNGIDGAIALDARWGLFHAPDALAALHIPYVRIQSAAMMPELPPDNTLYVSEAENDRKLATYFLANGMKQFVVIEYSNYPLSDPRNRHFALFEALRAAGVPESAIHPLSFYRYDVQNNISGKPDITPEILRYLETSRAPVAFVVNEFYAQKLVRRALELGKRFKKDCSIVGSINVPMALMESCVEISSVETPMARLAQEGLEMLYSMIRNRTESIPNRSLNTKLTILDT